MRMSAQKPFHRYMSGQHLVKDIPFKAHKITGFSPESLEQHFVLVYGAAIRRLNEIELQITADAQPPSDMLLHEQLTVADRIILHEISFDSLCEESGLEISNSALEQSIDQSFGSHEQWLAEFRTMAAIAGTTWMILAWSERLKRLVNIRCSGELQKLSAAQPVLVIDMSEPAYSRDFGSQREGYVAAFIQSINWPRVDQRFQQASSGLQPEERVETDSQISVANLKLKIDAGEDLIVLDVRHDDDRERYTSRIMETDFRDSFDVASWANELPKDKPVIVYCMYGFWVSTKVAEELREHGFDARSLSGGVL